MKTKIIDLLRNHPDLPAGEIATQLGEKRSSVSKCLTRAVRKGEVHFQRREGLVRYRVPTVANPSAPVASATVSANS